MYYNATRKVIPLSGDREIIIETGKLAKQADGSVVVKQGNTMLLATVTAAKEPKDDCDFMPLSVEYKEKYASCGRFPGGFLKREARPSDYEILVSRLIDRALRPLFPSDFHAEVFVTVNLISADKDIMPDALAGLAASAALAVSDVPFGGPISEVRVARINGEFVINPTFSQNVDSDLDIMVGATIDNILMVEGEMKEVSEAVMLDAIKFAHEEIKKHCAAQIELSKELGKDVKRVYCHETNDEELRRQVIEATYDKAYEIAKAMTSKHERMDRFDRVGSRVRGSFQRRRARREENADQALFPRRRAEKGDAQHDPRGGNSSRRPSYGRNSPDLVRDRLSAGSSRFGDFHPGRNAVADDRNARHENGRKADRRRAGSGNRAVRAAL